MKGFFIGTLAMGALVFCCSGFWGRSDSGHAKIVLIANGGTEYENAVTAILREKLASKHITTKIVNIAAVGAEDARAFDAILLMNAVKEDTLTSEVRDLLRRTPTGESGPWPYVIASTVTGRNWLSKDSNVDAITAATKVTQARNVATQLYGRIRSILDGRYK